MATLTGATSAGWAVMSRGRLLLVVGLAMAIAGMGFLVLGRAGDSPAPARELVMAAHDSKFNHTNPPLELKVGERVALTIVNNETTAIHDFVITGLGVRLSYLPPGASQTLLFTPSKPGVFRYGCSLHPGLMDGQVIVRSG